MKLPFPFYALKLFLNNNGNEIFWHAMLLWIVVFSLEENIFLRLSLPLFFRCKCSWLTNYHFPLSLPIQNYTYVVFNHSQWGNPDQDREMIQSTSVHYLKLWVHGTIGVVKMGGLLLISPEDQLYLPNNQGTLTLLLMWEG